MKDEEGRFQKMEMFLNQAVLYMVNLDYSKNERNNLFFGICLLVLAYDFREFFRL